MFPFCYAEALDPADWLEVDAVEFEEVPFELEVVPLEAEAPFTPVEELDVVDPLEAPVVPAFVMVAPGCSVIHWSRYALKSTVHVGMFVPS